MQSERMLSFGLLLLRVLTGLGMAYHGYGKVFGGQITQLTEGVTAMGFPFPVAFAWLAALSEFAGGLFLAVGFATRFAAFFIFVTMSVAAFKVHAADPLQVKELALAYWTISFAILFTGPGNYSVDRLRNR